MRVTKQGLQIVDDDGYVHYLACDNSFTCVYRSTYVKTYQIVHYKCVQFLICHLHLNKKNGEKTHLASAIRRIELPLTGMEMPMDRAALERRLSSVLEMLYLSGLLDIQVRYQMGSKKKKIQVWISRERSGLVINVGAIDVHIVFKTLVGAQWIFVSALGTTFLNHPTFTDHLL